MIYSIIGVGIGPFLTVFPLTEAGSLIEAREGLRMKTLPDW